LVWRNTASPDDHQRSRPGNPQLVAKISNGVAAAELVASYLAEVVYWQDLHFNYPWGARHPVPGAASGYDYRKNKGEMATLHAQSDG
jgi:hypothetical protein